MRTSETQYNRRQALRAGMGFVGLTALAAPAQAGLFDWFKGGEATPEVARDPLELSTFQQYRSYSNAYEFGTSKGDPAQHEDTLITEGWTVDLDGQIRDIDQIRGMPFGELPEEDFNFRCVEAWGMRVNYNGFPLSQLLKEYGDINKKYVAFTCVHQDGLPGQRGFGFNWPYTEALTMEEAMHPLTWAVFGNYGKESVANGAPLRINIPWKYGFKSPKFVVGIHTTDDMPPATWNRISQREYGWYSNVYPDIDHPRWRQSTHRHITESGTTRIPTLRYNGYEEEVRHMYPGEDWDYR